MSKFVIVKKAPAQLGKGEVVISLPDFVEQARIHGHKGAKREVTTVNQLRDILMGVESKFEVNLEVYKIPVSKYEGLGFQDDFELGQVVMQILRNERPESFDKILEYNIKNRPYGTKLIHYVGHIGDTGAFFRLGIDMIEEKDVDEFLGLKPKKVVGKPAVTKEQSEETAS